MDASFSTRSAGRARHRALRLIFRAEGSAVQLVAAERLAMLAPPPHALRPERREQGCWIELRDERGEPLYRRNIEYPLPDDLEVIADDSGRLARVRAERQGGTFYLVVPDIAQACTAVLNTVPRFAERGSRLTETAHQFRLPRASGD